MCAQIPDYKFSISGQVVSGYRVRDGQWTLIGRQSPQLPQVFLAYFVCVGVFSKGWVGINILYFHVVMRSLNHFPFIILFNLYPILLPNGDPKWLIIFCPPFYPHNNHMRLFRLQIYHWLQVIQ